MKKILLFTVCGVFFAGMATAQFINPNGNPITTVEQIELLSDETPVVLEGNITKHIRSDKYQFEDSTGNIVVEIDEDEWRGVKVSPADKVRIKGEVDKEFMEKTIIDVENISII